MLNLSNTTTLTQYNTLKRDHKNLNVNHQSFSQGRKTFTNVHIHTLTLIMQHNLIMPKIRHVRLARKHIACHTQGHAVIKTRVSKRENVTQICYLALRVCRDVRSLVIITRIHERFFMVPSSYIQEPRAILRFHIHIKHHITLIQSTVLSTVCLLPQHANPPQT